MVLVAGLGGPGHHRELAALVGRTTHATATLRALGYSGNVELAPLLLQHALRSDDTLAEVSREALATLLGHEVDAVAESEEGVAELASWWNGARTRWDVRERVLAGLPATKSAFATALLAFPTRRRFFAALLLSVRTGGTIHVATRAASVRQRAQLSAVTASHEHRGERWAREFTDF
jgi:hypothetical protein